VSTVSILRGSRMARWLKPSTAKLSLTTGVISPAKNPSACAASARAKERSA
jgi:hypothetical protein